MRITSAFLIQEYTEEEKKRLQVLNAFYSMTHRGWFVTDEQYDKFSRSATDPSVLPTPSVPTNGTGIFIDDTGSDWKIYGDTYTKKDILKRPDLDLKPRWSSIDKSWRIERQKIDRQTLERLLQ